MKRIVLPVLLFYIVVFHVQGQSGGSDRYRPGSSDVNIPSDNTITSLEIVDQPITSVFKMVSDLTGWSIIASPVVSERPPRINIWIKNLTPAQVIEQVTSMSGLVMVRDVNTIHVMTFDEYATHHGVEKVIISLKHASAKEIASILKPFGDEKNSKVVADEWSNSIVLLMPAPLTESISQLIESLDVPYASDKIQVIRLKYLPAKDIVPILESFLAKSSQRDIVRLLDKKSSVGKSDEPTQQAGQGWLVHFMAEPKLNAIILRGLASDVEKTAELIKELDIAPEIETVGYQLEYTNAVDVFTTLQDILETGYPGGEDKGFSGTRLRMAVSEQNNRIIVEGSEEDHVYIKNIIKVIDQPHPPGSGGIRIYRLVNTSSSEVYHVISELIENNQQLVLQISDIQSSDTASTGQGGSQSVVTESDEKELEPVRISEAPEINAVIILASAAEHEQFAAVIDELDKPRESVFVHSYSLKWTDAQEAYAALESLLQKDIGVNANQGEGNGENYRQRQRVSIAVNTQNNSILVNGTQDDHERISQVIETIDQTHLGGSSGVRVYRLVNTNSSEVASVLNAMIDEDGRRSFVQDIPSDTAGSTSEMEYANLFQSLITEAPEINAVIINSSASSHRKFEEIIADLDRPRDQVHLEVTMVIVVHTDDFELGVEIGGSYFNSTNVVGATSFGIGDVDSETGLIKLASPLPIGLNLNIFNSDDISLVVNALKTVGMTKIVSKPKIVVQDNSPAVIRQITQEPYELASQGSNTTITSFGGFVDAGTTLQVTPHISRDNWLRLDYEINQSTFSERTTEQEEANLPPAKREVQSSGTVRVPFGHTVVLGGLSNAQETQQIDGVPLLSDIPIIGAAFRNETTMELEETLFIFVKPVVLRDVGFADLLYLTDEEMRIAKLDQEELLNEMKIMQPRVLREGD